MSEKVYDLDNIWRTWKFAGIYGIVHVESGKIYVGQSNNIAKRIYYHREANSKCKYICNAIQKYGWDAFNVFLLEQVDDLTKLTEQEQKWINYFESYKPENGYNICPAADSCRGVKHSAETRAKMSLAQKGKHHSEETKIKIGLVQKGRKSTFEGKHHSDEAKIKISLAGMGRVHSEEARNKISLTMKGKVRSEEHQIKNNMAHQKKVLQLDAKTKMLIRTWPSILEVEESLGIGSGHISQCCHGERKTTGGFAWQFAPTGDQPCLTQ